VEAGENFPNQLVNVLQLTGYEFEQPYIIAKTGWTTDELQKAINEADIEGPFDFVTLLIGVNNQYRGRTVEDYVPQFEDLLIQCLRFAGDNQRKVIVISIPDWGVTPFASLPKDDGSNHNVEKVATEIDAYNEANKSISERYGVHYVEITESTRRGKFDLQLVAVDGLHPSAKEYSDWTDKIFSIIKTELSRQ
jgi:lysophospholipase L1-like esterase